MRVKGSAQAEPFLLPDRQVGRGHTIALQLFLIIPFDDIQRRQCGGWIDLIAFQQVNQIYRQLQFW